MVSFVRPLLIGVLCSLTVFGPAAAWLHVAECQHEGIAQASSAEITSDCQHSCCVHSHQTAVNASEPDSNGSDGTGVPHDHDSCAVCQSVALPNGVDWQLTVALAGTTTAETCTLFDTLALSSLAHVIPEPRGPPAIG